MSCNVPLFDVDILKNPAVSDTERVMKLLGVMQCTTPRSTVIYKVEHKKIDESIFINFFMLRFTVSENLQGQLNHNLWSHYN